MRGQGRIFRPKVRGRVTSVWWLDYSIGGERFRESSGTTGKRAALKKLREKITSREEGKVIGRPERVTLQTLREGLERHYQRDGNRSLVRAKQALVHLEQFLGAERRASDITPHLVNRYIEHRIAEGVARSTTVYEVRILCAAFSVAVEERLLAVRPTFKLPKVENARTGFFEEGDFAALVLELPADIQPLVRFLRLTGWRRSEALGLTWDQVDFEGSVVRLAAADTKGGFARLFPFALAPDLKRLLEAQHENRNGLFVFHRKGERIGVGGLRSAWKHACKRAGLDGRLVHDLRRSAARDFRRAGVSEGEIMKLCGWKTRAMFDRYNIIDEDDLAAAVARRFNGKQAANTGTPTVQPNPVTSSAA
jgi:integrase